MKQLDLTPQIQTLIANAVGSDVESSGFSVFEAIAANNLPLPGKGNSIFANAVIAPMTLQQMADSINGGNSLPLIFSHDMSGTPVGRAFYGETVINDAGNTELRVLFYVDSTEGDLITKLDSASVDEVSVSFLPTQIGCSDCGFDFLGADSTSDNVYNMTCDQGHVMGEGDTHANLIGLSRFIELSLVTRGAADGAKIVGKSNSKLQPSNDNNKYSMRLAARGFDTDSLICRASHGEDNIMNVDVNKLVADLAANTAQVAILNSKAEGHAGIVAALETQVADAGTQVVTLKAEVADLQGKLDAASATPDAAIVADHAVALSFLTDTAKKVLVAAGKAVPESMPATAAELTTIITDCTTQLSAILPIGGRSEAPRDEQKPKANFGSFKMAPGK